MNNENSPNSGSIAEDSKSAGEKNTATEPLPVHNPLNPADKKQVTQEDIENEQKYKEALSERD